MMMYKEMINEFLKYIDCFGTKFNFYIDKDRKFYTPLGGILSMLALFFGIMVFIFINFEDFLHSAPISSFSILRDNYKNVKFGEEKIWIPWRIKDYKTRLVNHTNLFYPIIYYYQGIKNESTQAMDLSYNLLNYKLCNETSMINKSELYVINVSLDNIYCIDMDDLNMGGNWQTNFINYIKFDLYLCKDGINYNESLLDCSSFEKIIETASEDNSFGMEFFYPVVYFQPDNKSTPMIVKYTSYFYHFSRYSNKIDRLFLQKNMLFDDNGWFTKNTIISSFWGSSSLNGDSYTTGDKKDLMNEGSTSRLYSFNIYLNSDIVYYTRTYKKMFIIIADRLPIVNIVCIFFSFIAKIFKISSGNKKLTELLFENLKEKPNKVVKLNTKINNEPFNVLKSKTKMKKNYSIKKNLSNTNIPQLKEGDVTHTSNANRNFMGNTTNNNINDISSSYIHLSPQHNQTKKLRIPVVEGRKSSGESRNPKLRLFKNTKNNKNTFSNIIANNSFNNNFNLNCGPIGVNNSNININIHNNLRTIDIDKSNESPKHQSSKVNIKKRLLHEEKKRKNNNDNTNFMKKETKKNYIKNKLFPYKYYIFSIFIKNFDINKKSKFFPKKFINVYNFLCQLFDISSYLILQKEFQIIKNTLMKGKYRALIENRQKINVNDHWFNYDMKECLDYQKLSILGRIKKSQSIDKVQ